ncbi:MAG: SAM-dependent methyltransferase [Bacilli bacterium]|nr:SAM-dependent methyltransferase [Bacilli bacterium]
MIINKRLKEVGRLVDDNSSFLDIGCDHAFLDIYLAQDKKRKFKKIVASDNKEGPLTQAKNNINQHKLSKEIELRLGDGLDTYTDDIDTVIISGMGGRNMIGIIKNHLEYLKTIDTFILSPNNYQVDVKEYLTKVGYYIEDEVLIKDSKFIYQIIKFKKGRKKYSKKELFFGPVLLTKKDDNFMHYYKRELKSREIIMELLPKGFSFRKVKLKKEMKLIKSEINN